MQRRAFLGACLGGAAAIAGCRGAGSRVVLYCAQDREFAESILVEFTAQTGLDVPVKYDTEADKSVALYEELIREKDRPRCDVHWNNEILATIRLRRQGVLESWEPAASAPYPDWAKASDHCWHAFASRARVLLVNTKLVPDADRPKSLLDLVDPKWKGKIAMAKPLFGTTATQAACLFEVLGPAAAEKFYKGLADNSIQIVPGNKQSAEAVSRGEAAIGLTDTDDAIIEVKAKRPVAMVFPDREPNPKQPRLGTLFIPNTMALIKGGPNPRGARKLIEYLLSEETEERLSQNESHQIPLNPKVKPRFPVEMSPAKTAHPMTVDFEKAADVWDTAMTFLKNTFAR